MPANAEPLLFAAEVNAYSTSDSPCGPLLSIDALGVSNDIAMPAPISTISGMVRM